MNPEAKRILDGIYERSIPDSHRAQNRFAQIRADIIAALEDVWRTHRGPHSNFTNGNVIGFRGVSGRQFFVLPTDLQLVLYGVPAGIHEELPARDEFILDVLSLDSAGEFLISKEGMMVDYHDQYVTEVAVDFLVSDRR